jgi:outer membrane autotransporter protein
MTRGGSGTSVWLRGHGQWVNVDTDPEADGYDQDSNGLIGGVDHAFSANAMAGGAVAYTNTDVDFDEPGDTADVKSWQVGAYGSYGFGKFYLDGVASYAWHDVNAQRTITLPSITYLATSAYNASAWSVQGEVGAIWVLGRVNMQPSVALAYTGANTDGFSETVSPSAPGIGLVVADSDSDSLATTLALRASGQWMMAKTQVVPDIKLGWRHEFEDGRQSFTANFFEDLTAPASMSIVSSAIQPDSLVVSTGATFGVTRNFEVFFDLNGQYNADASATNASGGVRLTW